MSRKHVPEHPAKGKHYAEEGRSGGHNPNTAENSKPFPGELDHSHLRQPVEDVGGAHEEHERQLAALDKAHSAIKGGSGAGDDPEV